MNRTENPIRHRVAAAATALLIIGTGVVSASGPASAGTSSPNGAGWITRNAAGAVSSWSTTGTKPSLADLGGGKWTAKFTGITSAIGVPAVAPGNQFPGAMCAVDSYPLVAGNLAVNFHCTDRKGSPVKSDFTITYTSIGGATEGWLDANQPAFNGTYTPAAQYDAAGLKITVVHASSSPGIYQVILPGVVVIPSFGSMTATPVIAGIGHCNLGSADWDDHTELGVFCYNAAGAPTDMRFVAHIVGKRALLATAKAKSGWAIDPGFSEIGKFVPPASERYTSNGQKVSINHTAIGTYVVTFKGLATTASRGAQAFSYEGPGAANVRCGAVATASGADAIVTVKCTLPTGAAVDTVVTANLFGI